MMEPAKVDGTTRCMCAVPGELRTELGGFADSNAQRGKKPSCWQLCIASASCLRGPGTESGIVAAFIILHAFASLPSSLSNCSLSSAFCMARDPSVSCGPVDALSAAAKPQSASQNAPPRAAPELNWCQPWLFDPDVFVHSCQNLKSQL